jgi:hypothetical protein
MNSLPGFIQRPTSLMVSHERDKLQENVRGYGWRLRLWCAVVKNPKTARETEGGSLVSDKLLKNLSELTRSIEENTSRVKESMTKSGQREPDSAVVSSAAKYHEALEKLSKE